MEKHGVAYGPKQCLFWSLGVSGDKNKRLAAHARRCYDITRLRIVGRAHREIPYACARWISVRKEQVHHGAAV